MRGRIPIVDDWKSKLEGLNQNLQARERAEVEEKASVLKAFRQRLVALEPIMKGAAEFGDAFGVDALYEVSRFDQRYPFLKFIIKRPALSYAVECRDGILHERLQEGEGPAQAATTSLEALTPKRFEQRVTAWVQAAAQANRKVPGRR